MGRGERRRDFWRWVGGFGVSSGRVSLCTATAASCHTVSPPRAKMLAPVARSCHGTTLASHVFLAFLPQIPGLSVFLKGEAGAWHEHPL